MNIETENSSPKHRSQSVEIVANLSLHMCLYFNAYFTPCWLLSHYCVLHSKLTELTEIYQFLTISSLVILTAVEIVRLYLGLTGNLAENLRPMLAFLLLSLLVQLPIHLFRQTDTGLAIRPLERAVDSIMLAFLAVEIPVAYFAITSAANRQIRTHR